MYPVNLLIFRKEIIMFCAAKKYEILTILAVLSNSKQVPFMAIRNELSFRCNFGRELVCSDHAMGSWSS